MPSQAASHLRVIIAANLDRAIAAKEWTNREVGDKIGKTEHQVWRWRTARHVPELETLAALADVLFDGDITEFYAEHDDRPVAA